MRGPSTDHHGPSQLEALQDKWGIVQAEQHVDKTTVFMPEPVSQESGQDVPSTPSFSCEMAGRTLMGYESEDLLADVARLEKIMRHNPIRPHRYEGGGVGFSYPVRGHLREKGWDLICEFSRLLFSRAGDVILSRYQERMDVIPLSEYSRPVKIRLWSVKATNEV